MALLLQSFGWFLYGLLPRISQRLHVAGTAPSAVSDLPPVRSPQPPDQEEAMSSTGRFVVFEGIDGCGKTTVSKMVAESMGSGALWTREPGDSPLGEQLRDVLLNRDVEIDPRAEALLMLADRAQYVRQLIRPAMQRGQWVISDRFTHSTVAYQGYGRHLDPNQLLHMSRWAADGLEPDLVLWLEVDPEEAQRRRVQSGKADRIEQAGISFQMLVHRGFKILSNSSTEPWAVIDASQPLQQVVQQSEAAIRQHLGWPQAEAAVANAG